MPEIGLYLNRFYFTLKREGLRSFLRKAYLRLIGYIVKLYYVRPDISKWMDLKGRFSGETVFLIGNGPSLNKTPLYLLRNQKVMTFNRFYLINERLNWEPTFYTVTDDLVLEDIKNDIEGVTESVEYSFFPDIHFRGKVFLKK